jgi:hypothetical protein
VDMGLLALGAGGHSSRTTRGPERSRATIFRLQFPPSLRQIHMLHVTKSQGLFILRTIILQV